MLLKKNTKKPHTKQTKKPQCNVSKSFDWKEYSFDQTGLDNAITSTESQDPKPRKMSTLSWNFSMVFSTHGLTDRVWGWKKELEMFCLTSYVKKAHHLLGLIFLLSRTKVIHTLEEKCLKKADGWKVWPHEEKWRLWCFLYNHCIFCFTENFTDAASDHSQK